MKKILFLIFAIIFFFTNNLYATGTITATQTLYNDVDGKLVAVDVTVTMTGDSSTGAFPTVALSSALTAAQQAKIAGMYLFSIDYVVGGIPPTSGFGIAILNASGNDILGGQATSVTTTSAFYNLYAGGTAYRPLLPGEWKGQPSILQE